MHAITFLSALFLITSSTGGVPQDHAVHAIAPTDLRWGPGPSALPKGVEVSVLAGDPAKPGLFTLRARMPAGYRIAAHQHPTSEAITVISGEFGVGMGDKLDEAKAQQLGPGAFVNLPANMNHFVITNTETVIQVTAEGPFEIKYVNPADDPRKTQ
jgi:quercetin dioxygenase-like cupin family protein